MSLHRNSLTLIFTCLWTPFVNLPVFNFFIFLTASQYLRGISVKITEKYRPPRKITFPPGLGQLQPPADLFRDDVSVVLFPSGSAE